MAFTLPPLPYDYAALEPHIDEQTMRIHHDKHHAAYVNNLNAALEGEAALQSMSIEQLLGNLGQVPEAKRGRRAEQRRRTLQSHAVLGTDGTGRRRARRPANSPRRSTRRSATCRVQGTVRQGVRHPFRQRLGLAGARRGRRPRHREHAEPGFADHGRQACRARLRRLGARLLPQVPEPPPRLRQRLVECGELDGRRPAVRGKMTDAVAAALPAVGSVAPDFTLRSTAGADVTLSAFRGTKNVLLAFFPLAFTSTCTAEMCAFTDDFASSPRTTPSCCRSASIPPTRCGNTRRSMQMTFDLLSDFKRDRVAPVWRAQRARSSTPIAPTSWSTARAIVRWAWQEEQNGDRRENRELLAEPGATAIGHVTPARDCCCSSLLPRRLPLSGSDAGKLASRRSGRAGRRHAVLPGARSRGTCARCSATALPSATALLATDGGSPVLVPMRTVIDVPERRNQGGGARVVRSDLHTDGDVASDRVVVVARSADGRREYEATDVADAGPPRRRLARGAGACSDPGNCGRRRDRPACRCSRRWRWWRERRAR